MELTLTQEKLVVSVTSFKSYTMVKADIQDPVVSAKVAKLIRYLTPHDTDFREKVEELKDKHAKKDKNGKPVTEKVTVNGQEKEQYVFKDKKALESEVQELKDMEITIYPPVSFTYDDLASLRPNKELFPYGFIESLSYFIKDDE